MKIFKFFTFLALITLTAISCSKDDTAPVITITSPKDGTTYGLKDTISIQGMVTDDNELAEINIAGNKVTSFTSKSSHNIDGKLTFNPAQTLGDFNFEVTAKDKEGNSSSKIIKLKIQ